MTFLGPTTVFILCLATSLLCAILLVRAYLSARSRLLLWSAIGFAGLAVNNLLLVADRLVLPAVDLWLWRQVALGLSIAVLLYGFLWEVER